MKWRKFDIYDAVCDVGLFRLLVMRQDGNTVWWGVDCVGTRVSGGFSGDIQSAKIGAVKGMIERIKVQERQALEALAELEGLTA